jgi:hypothetical protein
MRIGISVGLSVFLTLIGTSANAETHGKPVTGCWKKTDLDADTQRMEVLKRDAQCFTIPDSMSETIEVTEAEASCINLPGAAHCLWIRVAAPGNE